MIDEHGTHHIDLTQPWVEDATVVAARQVDEWVHRNTLSGLTSGQVQDHQGRILALAKDIDGGEFDTRHQIANAVRGLSDDIDREMDW